MLIAPKRKRNSLWSFILNVCFPISAAWDAPSPGRHAVNGDEMIEASEDFIIDFFESLMFFRGVVFCMGIFVFCLTLIIRFEAPKSPVSKGRSG